MRKQTKQYETPERGWQEERIADEKRLREDYGLTNKKEIWKAQSTVRKFRRQARKLNAEKNEREENDLINKLVALGILEEDDELNDILDIGVEDVLERRLQTVVYRRGIAETPRAARQIVNHGHILIGERRVNIPSYLVRTDEEENIRVKPGSEGIVE